MIAYNCGAAASKILALAEIQWLVVYRMRNGDPELQEIRPPATDAPTATDRVYRAIRQGILSRRYGEDGFLREEALARGLQSSRTPVREALRRLVSEGWLEQLPHRGARVVQWTPEDVDEVFELRSILEAHAARRAAARIEAGQLERLRTLAAGMERLCEAAGEAERERIAALNDTYHSVVLAAAGSPRLQKLIEAMVQAPISSRSFFHYESDELTRSMQHHREIITALENRDANWAAAVMRAHILAGRRAHMRAGTTASVPRRIEEESADGAA